MIFNEKWNVYIPWEEWGKAMHLCKKQEDTEIGWLFKVVRDKGWLVPTEIAVLKQEVATGGMSVKIDPAEIEAWQVENCVERPPSGMPLFDYGWGHSHVKQGTTKSATDQEFIEDHATRGLFLTLIFNQLGKVNAYVHTYCGGVLKRECKLVELEVGKLEVGSPALDAEIVKVLDEMVEAKVTEVTRVVVTDEAYADAYGWNGYGYGGRSQCYFVCAGCGQKGMQCKCKDAHAFVSKDRFNELEAARQRLTEGDKKKTRKEKKEERKKQWGHKGRENKIIGRRVGFPKTGNYTIREIGTMWDGAIIHVTVLTAEVMAALAVAGLSGTDVVQLRGTGTEIMIPPRGQQPKELAL